MCFLSLRWTSGPFRLTQRKSRSPHDDSQGPLWTVPLDLWLPLSLALLSSFVPHHTDLLAAPWITVGLLHLLFSLPNMLCLSFVGLLPYFLQVFIKKMTFSVGSSMTILFKISAVLPTFHFLFWSFLLRTCYCLTHCTCLSSLISGSPLQCTFHKGRDFVYFFFSLLYPQHLQQCQPHGRIQYLGTESMTTCLKARRLPGEVGGKSTTQTRDHILKEQDRDRDEMLTDFPKLSSSHFQSVMNLGFISCPHPSL